MAHVVMQSAEFATVEQAQKAESELKWLCDAYTDFEANDPDPWNQERIPPPLIEFGKRHGLDWPNEKHARFLLKGGFAEMVELLRLDRMVFFWGGGFDMGDEPLRQILRKLGATDVRETCDLIVKCTDPDSRIAELAQFLEDEDFEEQYFVDDYDDWAYFSVKLEGDNHSRMIWFDDSGVQDWAFVTMLYQLDGEDPRFAAPASD